MRETKFHLWDNKRKIMYYYEPTWGNYEHGNGWIGAVPLDEYEKDGRTYRPPNQQQVSPSDVEWLQYTDIEDITKKEIYEGHLVLIGDSYKDRILDDGSGPTEPFNHIAPVVFRSGCFGVDIQESGEIFKMGFHTLREVLQEVDSVLIVGTVFENPELIGGK